MALPITILIFLFIFLLLWASNMVVVGLRRIARATHAGVFAISAILLALATSFPELGVAITSGLSGESTLSLGNVLGANITNLTLVSGAAALVAGKVNIQGGFLKREVLIALLAGLLPLLLMLDGGLSRIDGLILIAVWGAYVTHFFHIRFRQIAQKFQEEGWWYRFLHKVNGRGGQETARLLIGVALLLFSADMIVRLAKVLAGDAGIPLILVGVVVLAVGTTLPELVFSFKSILSGEPTMFFGNILGSIIINSTLVLGVASVLSPSQIPLGAILKIGAAFLIIYLLFWFFIRTKYSLSRKEALILLILYGLFILVVGRS